MLTYTTGLYKSPIGGLRERTLNRGPMTGVVSRHFAILSRSDVDALTLQVFDG
jgi:hypothetical protein